MEQNRKCKKSVPRGEHVLSRLSLAVAGLMFCASAHAAVGPFGFVADSSVRIVDLRTSQTFPNTVIPVASVDAMIVNKTGDRIFELYHGTGGIGVRDTTTNTYAAPLVSPGQLSISYSNGDMAQSVDGKYLLVATGNEVAVVDANTGTIVKRIGATFNVIHPVKVAVEASGKEAYVADDCGGLAVIDTATWNVTKTIDLAPGYIGYFQTSGQCQPNFRPTSVAVAANGAVLVQNKVAGAIHKVDVKSGAIISTVNVGGNPRTFTLNADSTKAYVALLDVARIAVVDLGSFTVSYFVTTDSPAIDLSSYGDGTIYGVFDRQSNGQYWLASIDNTGAITKRIQTVPGAKRLLVTDLSTDLATVFNPIGQSNPITPTGNSQPSASGDGGGGGGGGCTVGAFNGGVDPLLPVLAAGAIAYLMTRRRAGDNRSS